jgi:hypothetical protein
VAYCTEANVRDLASAQGVDLRFDDDADGSVPPPDRAAFMAAAIRWAGGRVDFYCGGRYSPAQLAASATAEGWATTLALYWICLRRFNPVPESIRHLAEDEDFGVLPEMRLVQTGAAQLPGAGEKKPAMPLWSNVTVDDRYWVKKLRVVESTSDPVRTRAVDHYSAAVGPWEW